MAQKTKNKESFFSKIFSKGKIDYSILVVTLLLLSIGIIMVLSASAPTSLAEDGTSYSYVKKQVAAAIGGLCFMYGFSKIDYRIYRRLRNVIYIITLAILLAVTLMGLSEGGATRWIRIAGIPFQPSEFAKVALIVFFASYLSDVKEKNKIKDFKKGFFIPLVFLAPIALILFKGQNHMSATIIIAAITLIQMFVAGTKFEYLAAVIAVAASGLVWMLTRNTGENTDFRTGRMQAWLDPFADPKGKGYQTIQSLYAIGSGGLLGLGLWQSKQKYLYLPEPHNDFIFAILAEELGFVGCVFVILLFMIFVWRGIIIAIKAPDNFGTLIAIGIVAMIGLQALINIAVVTNTIPVTGMALPFFSYGGSAMVANLSAVGILLNVSRSYNK